MRDRVARRAPGWVGVSVRRAEPRDRRDDTAATDEVVRLLDHLHVAGNNGWFDRPGKRDALRLLSELRTTAPYLDERFIASYMLGMGKVSAEAAKHLLALAGSGSGATQ